MIYIIQVRTKTSQAIGLLNDRISKIISRISGFELCSIQEIRLRRGGYLSVTVMGQEKFVRADGRLSDNKSSAAEIFDDDIEYTYLSAMKHSLHSFENEIRQGYITTEGGCRVGFCGRAVYSDSIKGGISTVKDISSVNVRIASEVIGCSEEIIDKLYKKEPISLLICGPPGSGKTTVLRDLCRVLSERFSISLVDERCELAAAVDGVPQNDAGCRTDVFSSYTKLAAIMTAVRVMNPRIIVCDEIGVGDELEAYEYAINSGVSLIASCHASNLKELYMRPVVSELIKKNGFDCTVFLGTGSNIGKVMSYHFLGENECSDFSAAY